MNYAKLAGDILDLVSDKDDFDNSRFGHDTYMFGIDDIAESMVKTWVADNLGQLLTEAISSKGFIDKLTDSIADLPPVLSSGDMDTEHPMEWPRTISYRYFLAMSQGETRTANEVMDSLGITYAKFFNYIDEMDDMTVLFSDCRNIPENLPDYIKVMQ